MRPISIMAARMIAKNFGYDQVIIIARKIGAGEHVTTYGSNKENCDVAARIGDFLKFKVMGWASEDRCEKLKDENAVLRDLLETQYRETDKARVESDKADDEALEHKLEAARLRALGTKNEYNLVWELKRRLDAATSKIGA